MIGWKLGWLDLNIPDYLVSVFLILMAVSTFRRTYESLQLNSGMRFTLFCFSSISIILIIMGNTLTWTPAASPVAEGVQGRYFLPLLVPVIWLLKNRLISVQGRFNKIVIYQMTWINMWILMSAFSSTFSH